ncbi:MAG: 5'-nucleotidase C-terminal domain-containing protein [Deltaproteobacteria bacterium]|nr:5'-nucleotidase C-terminal domain-containing protein [Deltaproteobacteria bacterium]
MNQRALLAQAIAAFALAGLPAQAETRLVFTSEVHGRIASPVCEPDRPLETSAFSERVAPALVRAAAQEALVIDTGGLLAINGVARFAAERDPAALAALVSGLGYAAIALSTADLAGARPPALAVWKALRDRGVAVLAGNLRCEPKTADLCAALQTRPWLWEQGAGRVALLGVLRADALARVGEAESAGLSLEDPAAAIARGTREARGLGATLVVAIVDGPGDDGAAAYALSLARALPADARPDVLLAARAGRQVLFARTPEVRPALAAAPPGKAIELRVRAGPDGEADLLARPLPEAPGAPEAISSFLARLGPAYCAVWGRTLPGGHLARPLDASGLLELAAGAARAAAHAEVAIVNRGAVDEDFSPASADALSASDVYLALPYDDSLMIAQVTGEWLQARAATAASRELLLLGVDRAGKQVAGRPLEARARYQVVTSRFLARGGNAALPAGPEWRPLDDASLRGALLSLLERSSILDPRDAVPDPVDAVAWTFRPDLDARLAASSISNPGGYQTAPLQRIDSLTLGGEANLRAAADTRRWLWENELALRYRSTRTRPPDTGAVTLRDDFEGLRSTFTARELFGVQRWFRPQPYAEAYGESESAATDGEGHRRWLLRGSTGLRFSLAPALSVKLAAALARELGDAGPRTLLGLNAQLTLTPWELARIGGRRIELDSSLDGFAGGATAQVTLRGHLGVLIDLLGPLALVFATDLYVERDGSGPAGLALDTSAGLRVRLFERLSSF